MVQFDWENYEQHVGALVLCGNRCVLVCTLKVEWKGMRIPSFPICNTESINDTAIHAVVKHTEVKLSEVTVVDMISPITVYAPNGRRIVMKLLVLYATNQPPDGPLEEADMEDDETPYDWYTYSNAMNRLDERLIAALRSLLSILIETANVGVLPEITMSDAQNAPSTLDTPAATVSNPPTAPMDQWTPSPQDNSNLPSK